MVRKCIKCGEETVFYLGVDKCVQCGYEVVADDPQKTILDFT